MNNRPSFRRFVFQSDDGSPSLNEEEYITHQFPEIRLAFSADADEGVGTLFITTNRIIWIGTGTAYDFDVPYITMHAVTHDQNSFPDPCLYCQLDSAEGDEDFNECYFIPPQEDILMKIFQAFSEAALNNPDEEFSDEDGDELIYNVDEVVMGAEQARALEHLESVFHPPSDTSNGQVNNLDEQINEN
jgi:hypothetical protein